MKKTTFLAVASSLVLAGCASNAFVRGINPHNPNVSVVEGYIVVDQEPIVVPKNEKDFLIVWQLSRGSAYSFPDDGIVVARSEEEFKCHPEADKQRFSCVFRNSKPGKYKYTIKVLDGLRPLRPLDPTIVNS
ncbi:MAG TPA: hypothetical protein VGK37_01885 [Casimicrobiaceae bacterium]|jgi:hypothetical protein